MLKRLAFVAVVVMVSFMAVACATQKAPAEAAITAAETALNAAKGEAAKFVPDQVKGVEDALAAAKDSFAKGDYQAALTAAQALPAQVSALTAAATAKKDELTKSWTSLSEGLPKVVEAIQSRVAMLAKAKKLPATIDKAKFTSAQEGLKTITETWAEATTAFGAGNLQDAVAKAGIVKTRAAEVLGFLGMPVPAGLQ
jgi:hypothetical protein